MKILICHNDYQQRGGESEVVDKEIQLLNEIGIEVVQYRVHNDQIKHFSLCKKIFFFVNTIFNVSSYRKIYTLICETKPDIVHVHNVFPVLSPSIYYACFRYKIPVVQTIHNFRFFCPNGLFFTQGKICERCAQGNFWYSIRFKCYRDSFVLTALYALTIWVHRKFGLLAKISLYIALTEFGKQKLISLGIRGERIVVKPNFIEDSSEESLDGNYGVYIGRLSKEKGIETLLDALQICSDVNLQFKFVGSGELEHKVISFVKNYPTRAKFLGYLSGEKKKELLRNAKFIVVPSECYENMPTAVLEAFMYGKPVIVSRIGSLPFIVTHEKTGLLFNSGDAQELSRSIYRLISDKVLCQKLSRNAQIEFQTYYSRSQQYEYFSNIYSSVLQKNKGI